MLDASNDYGIVNFFDDLPSTDPLIQFSVVSGQADTQPRPKQVLWSRLTDLFSRPSIRDNKDGTAWIPATFGGLRNDKGNLRHSGNVLSIHGIMLDLDGKGQTYTTDELRARFSGFQYLAHTTYRHTPENPRWRVFLPTSSPLHPTQLKNAIRKVAAAFNLDIDTSCVDASRLYFMPSAPRDRAYHYRLIHDTGRLLDVGDLPNLSLCDEDVDVKSPPPMNRVVVPSTLFIERKGTTAYSSVYGSALLKNNKNDFDGQMQMAAVMGLEQILGKQRSILPGHWDEDPSTALFVGKSGEIFYQDFSQHSQGKFTYNLPELRATLAYGEVGTLNKPELAVWRLRLMYEAGLIEPANVDFPPCPDGVSEGMRKVYEGMRLLFGLRVRWQNKRDPFPFALGFGASWSDVSGATVSRARLDLQEAGIFSIVDRDPTGCPILLPGKVRKRKPKKTSPEPRRATESHAPDKQTRLHISLAADRLMADYEGMALKPDEVITALAEYSGIPEIALKRHYSDLLRSIVRDFKKGRR